MDSRWKRTETVPAVPFQSTNEKQPYLLVLAGPQFGQIYKLELGRETIVGRQEGSVDICIGDHGVSRRHASILASRQSATIRDLESANGTYVEGTRVSECMLTDGSRIHIGAHSVLKLTYSDEIELEYQRRLTEGALREPLTGLCNRRHFMERLTSELSASQRRQHSLTLLLIDIDHFKSVNDQFGHLAGDEALKALSMVMQSAIRESDLLARYGGEEFVVLMRDSSLEDGKALAERIRKGVEKRRIPWKNTQLALTVSIGVSTTCNTGKTEPHTLLEAADTALYVAKRTGRNRVTSAPKSS